MTIDNYDDILEDMASDSGTSRTDPQETLQSDPLPTHQHQEACPYAPRYQP